MEKREEMIEMHNIYPWTTGIEKTINASIHPYFRAGYGSVDPPPPHLKSVNSPWRDKKKLDFFTYL